MEFHEAVSAAAGDAAVLAAFEALGSLKRRELDNVFADGIDLMTVKQIKDRKLYRLLRKPDGSSGRCTWEEFCENYAPRSARFYEEKLALEGSLGSGFCAAAARLGLHRGETRLLLSAPSAIQGEAREIVEHVEGAGDDRLREAVDQLIGKIAEQQADHESAVEGLQGTVLAKDGEIAKRKKDAGKLEERLRAKDRRIRELESGWAPSEEEDGAVKEIARLTAQIAGCLVKIGEQVRAVPESHAVIDQARGATQSVLNLNDDLRGLVHEVATGGEKEKRNGR